MRYLDKMEKEYLIKLCNSFINNKVEALDGSIDYSMLFEFSNAHNLSAVLFCVLKNAPNKDIIPADIYKRFEDDFYSAVFRYSIQGGIADELSSIFEENEIKHIFFKGVQLREYYPTPQSRVMGDVDVLIEEENREKVKALLTKNGYEAVAANGPVWEYSKNGFAVEVHTKIISGKVGASDAENGFADAIKHAAFCGYRGTLDNNYHFAYLLTHIAHHFWFYGAGIKLILDLAAFMKSEEIDLRAVLEKMGEIGLEDFSKVVLSVCKRWFSVGEDFGVDTKTTEKFISSFGAFGNLDRNKAAVIERKELEEGKKTSRLTTKFRLAFPPYSKLKNIPYISFIEGRPYLTPAAWVYRFYYNFKFRKAFVKKATADIGSEETKELAKKELDYFEEIGLL